MAKLETISVAAESAQDIKRMVVSGDYASTDEVVRAALEALGREVDDDADRLAWIKARIRASVEDKGPGKTAEEMRQHLDDMLARAEGRRRDSAA